MNHLSQTFTDTKVANSATTSKRKARKKLPPFSLRLSKEERQRLERDAAGMPLGSFIKNKVFDGECKPRRTRGRAPVKDHAALARALGLLGNLRLASNLNQLAKAVNLGTLAVSPEVEEELMTTCAAILAIRSELMTALGYKPEERE
ncbi:hypothetical protein [uncultured Roseobacter sp.]|uniref:hypothetical protein n=1 Tax=uncultured Roseobacter sp. TaxID=114847 RepID=UPI00260F57B4|nr:hypothetical protein [uncultured Roseobacter sp.]